MAKKKVYSLDNINELSGGDGAFISEMIHMFISHSNGFNEDVKNALAEQDIASLKSKAHKYKTSAQLFQIMDLHALLLKLESFSDFSERKEMDNILKDIDAISAEAVKQLKEELKKY